MSSTSARTLPLDTLNREIQTLLDSVAGTFAVTFRTVDAPAEAFFASRIENDSLYDDLQLLGFRL